MKKAILVVSFGTTYQDTRKKNIDSLVRKISEIAEDYVLYEAYTSQTVRRKLEEEGIYKDSMEQALARMKADGMEAVIVQPTHVIKGSEYNKIADAVREAEKSFSRIKLGKVLLDGQSDYETVADVLAQANHNFSEDTAVLWMGHGSQHQAGEAYCMMQEVFREKGYDTFFMGTVEGVPTFEEAVDRLHREEEKRGVRFEKITLKPFMLVAGDHANRDMAGEEDSWQTALESEGYQVSALCKGLGEYEGIRALYRKHLEELLQEQ